MRRGSWVLAAAVLLGFATAASAARIDREYRESFKARPGLRLHLEHGQGDVTVLPSDGDTVEVHARFLGTISRVGFGGTIDFVLDSHEAGDTLLVVGREVVEGGFELGFRSHDYDEYTYTVHAPRWVRLDLSGDDGTVRVSDRDGDVGIRLGDGTIELSDVRAERTTLSVEDGRIAIADHRGNLRIAVGDGELKIERSQVPDGEFVLEDGTIRLVRCAGAFKVEAQDAAFVAEQHRATVLEVATELGDITVDLLGGIGTAMRVGLASQEGRIALAVGPDVSAELTVERSEPGEMRVDLPGAKFLESTENRIHARVGAGRDLVDVRSWKGPIEVRGKLE